MSRDIHIVDVFAEERFGGNPLGVVIHDDDVPEQDMQPFARELGYSETTFVRRAPGMGGAFEVRIFMPGGELPFAGHPTLGSAWIARQHLLDDMPDQVVLEMAAGRVPVRFDGGTDDLLWLTAPTLELGATWDAADVYATLGLGKATPVDGAPVVLASAGMPILVVPVAGLDELRACDLDSRAFRHLAFTYVRQRFADVIVYVVTPSTRDPQNHLSARLFMPDLPVRVEDPATGAAAACMGAYLLEHPLIDPGQVRIEQGVDMGRPSLLHLRATRDAPEGVRIEVGGRVRPVLSGHLTF